MPVSSRSRSKRCRRCLRPIPGKSFPTGCGAPALGGRSIPVIRPVVQVKNAYPVPLQIHAGWKANLGRTTFLFFVRLQRKRAQIRMTVLSALATHFSIVTQFSFRMSRGNWSENRALGTPSAHVPCTHFQPYWILKVSEYRIHPRTLRRPHEPAMNGPLLV